MFESPGNAAEVRLSNQIDKSIGFWLRDKRISTGLSEQELAEKLQITPKESARMRRARNGFYSNFPRCWVYGPAISLALTAKGRPYLRGPISLCPKPLGPDRIRLLRQAIFGYSRSRGISNER
jgi:hypothetical protein